MLALAAGGPSAGATIRGQLQIALQGQAKPDRSGVVIFLADQAFPDGPRPQAAMAQQGRQFVPQVLTVPVGTTVEFPNRDVIEHNVFARSPHASVDLGRYGRGDGKSFTFDQAGVVDVYCNVHPEMIGHVVVVPGPWAVTAADGSFEIHGVTPGKHQLVLWDRLGTPAVTHASVDVPEHGDAILAPALIEAADHEPPHPNKFGGTYRAKTY
jgi:plastocyanin